MDAPFRVAIIGGGYAGYALARHLDPHLDVTLIEAREAFVHNVGAIRAMAEPGIIPQLLYPYARLLRRGRVVRGRAEAMDGSGVTLRDGQHIAADAIVIATGSGYAAPFKPQGDSAANFAALLAETATQLRAANSIVIVGAGAVGVELAGEIKAAHPGKRVDLVSDQPRLFPPYRPELDDRLVARLSALGVGLHLGAPATGLARTDAPHDGEIRLANGTTLAGLIVPAIGARVNPGPAHGLPGAVARANGQVQVDGWLRPSLLPNIFAIGDLAATGDGMTVVATMRQAPWLAKALRALAQGKKLESLAPYTPWPLAPILLPLGPKSGASVLPIGARGLVVGDWLTSKIKGKSLFIPRYRKEFGL